MVRVEPAGGAATRRRLRVAHVTATFPPYLAGTGNVAYHNALELARRGHEVHVFTAATRLPPGWCDPPEIRVHRLAAPLRLGNAPLTPALPWRLRGFDLVHLHWPYIFGAELTWLAHRLLGVPYVMTYHIDLIGAGVRARLFAAYQAIWVARLVRGAREIYAVSLDHFASTAGAESARRFGRAVREIPNGVDLERFAPGSREAARSRLGLPREGPLLLFVAALDRAHHYKGLSHLLEALGRLEGEPRLVVAGEGELRAGYEEEARRRGLGERVRFAGAVGHDRLPGYYRAADVTVLPSTHTESFGLVLAESLACGTPVVASNLPGVRSVVEDGVTGLLARPGDAEDLAAKMRAILEDPVGRERMGAAGRRRAEEHYDWRRVGEQLEQVYESVLSQPRGARLAPLPRAGRGGAANDRAGR